MRTALMFKSTSLVAHARHAQVVETLSLSDWQCCMLSSNPPDQHHQPNFAGTPVLKRQADCCTKFGCTDPALQITAKPLDPRGLLLLRTALHMVADRNNTFAVYNRTSSEGQRWEEDRDACDVTRAASRHYGQCKLKGFWAHEPQHDVSATPHAITGVASPAQKLRHKYAPKLYISTQNWPCL
jgi:hypothetical protein